MAKNSKNTNNNAPTNDELLASARKKKTGDRTENEQAAILQNREVVRARKQERITQAITKAVALNSSILTAANEGTIADRIEGLRDAMVNVEQVRAEARTTVKQQAVLPSIEAIINEANKTAQSAWAKALDEIRAMELASE